MKHLRTILAALLLTLPAAIGATEPRPSRFQHFITRQGDKLMDGDREFRFIGANMPGLVLPYDWTLYLPERLHLYSSYKGLGNGWPDTCRKEMQAVKGQRPFFIGEFGPYIDGKVLTPDNVVPKLREFLDFCCSEPGVFGAMIWSMYFHHQDGGFYWHQIMTYPAVWSYHWPGFPSAEAQREQGIMTAMREAAFKTQGLPVPPMPVPDAPELLSIGDVPLLTWRGSAGASGYDIERAPHAEGAWTTIAADVCDADIAYRPLLSDTTARAGQTYFYRVSARNSSGRSRPSNVVGPVTVKRVCLADELQDFSRVAAKSDGLTLNNAYNALYAEYLFRAQGSTNDWLTYQVPGTIESVKVVAFCPSGKIADLQFQAGETMLQPKRTERPLPSPPGGAAGGQRRTLLHYECEVPPGHSELKILWTGPAEMDRVEIEHTGEGKEVRQP